MASSKTSICGSDVWMIALSYRMPVFIDIDSPEHHLVVAGEGNAKTLSERPKAGASLLAWLTICRIGADIDRAPGIPSAQRGGRKNSRPAAALYFAKGPSD